jgi:hypothetical protein
MQAGLASQDPIRRGLRRKSYLACHLPERGLQLNPTKRLQEQLWYLNGGGYRMPRQPVATII